MEENIELRLSISKSMVKAILALGIVNPEVADNLKPVYSLNMRKEVEENGKKAHEVELALASLIAGIAVKDFEESKKKDNA